MMRAVENGSPNRVSTTVPFGFSSGTPAEPGAKIESFIPERAPSRRVKLMAISLSLLIDTGHQAVRKLEQVCRSFKPIAHLADGFE